MDWLYEYSPTLPGGSPARQIQRSGVGAAARTRRTVASQLYHMARRAETLADRWAEFPTAVGRHRFYASAFRSAAARRWLVKDPAARERVVAALVRRLAWKAYHRSLRPAPASSTGPTARARSRQLVLALKVDNYWAGQLWDLLGGDSVIRSLIRARDFELQQLYDSLAEPAAGPGLSTAALTLLRVLR